MIIGFIEFQFHDLDRGYVLRNINSTVAWKELSLVASHGFMLLKPLSVD